jgi:hypothetical protein
MMREWSPDFSGTREPMLATLQTDRQTDRQTDCRYSLADMLIRFERFDYELQRYGSVVKTCIMKFTSEDLLLMILMPKFW